MANTIVRNMVCIGGASLAATAGLATDVEAQGFEGAYGGLSFGLTNGTPSEFVSDDYAYSGGTVGLFAGYNFAIGDFLVGPELGWTREADANDNGFYDAYGLSDIIDLRVRAGTTFGNTFVYGALGYSRADAQWAVSGLKGGSSLSDTISGVSVGVGFEVNLSETMFFGADVTRRNFNRDTKYFENGDLTTATVRLGFRF
jgi:outer membrane autotransporter protein